jgi:hypothetical protein
MTKHIIVTALLVAGCQGTDPADTDDTTQAATLAEIRIDSSGLFDIPAGTIPAQRLDARAYNEGVIARKLLGSDEPLARVDAVASRAFHESTSWTLETDPLRGALLVIKKTKGERPSPQDPAVLQRTALARLASWGLPSTEVGRVLQRKAAAHDEDAEVPRTLSHKTFVFRQVLGVPIEAHRAVVTHGLDGALQRVLVKWPALAPSDHRLHTRLARPEIETRALDALRRENVLAASGPVALRWVYVATPAPAPTGEVALELVVAARVPADPTEDSDSEARDVLVDVGAVP